MAFKKPKCNQYLIFQAHLQLMPFPVFMANVSIKAGLWPTKRPSAEGVHIPAALVWPVISIRTRQSPVIHQHLPLPVSNQDLNPLPVTRGVTRGVIQLGRGEYFQTDLHLFKLIMFYCPKVTVVPQRPMLPIQVSLMLFFFQFYSNCDNSLIYKIKPHIL